MEINYDASHQLSYGYFACPHCKNQFYAGLTKRENIIMHDNSCPVREKGLEETIYCYGDKEISQIRSQYESFGEQYFKGTIQELILKKEVLS